MCTSIQLKEFLKEISEEARFVKFEYDSPEKFDVLLKCKTEENKSSEYYKEYVTKWIQRFSYFTNTAWMVRNTFPSGKRFLFKKTYTCHHAAHKVRTAKQQTRNMDCQAIINFKIMNNDKSNVTKDADIQEGLNMTIAIEFEHTHSLGKKKNSVNNRKSSKTVKNKVDSKPVFYKLFDEGYTALAAKCYHVLRLTEMYGQDSEELADGNLNPKIHQIQYLYDRRWKPKEINVDEVMTKKTETLKKIGHTIRYSVKPPFAVILTPLMKRVISQIGLRRVLIDATLEHGAPFTLFLYVPSMIGSLPVACVPFTEMNRRIGNSRDEYLQMFLTIKIAMQNLTGINFEPEVLLHDDDSLIKEALTEVFPNSMLILSRYSLCRDFWRWICDDRYCSTRLEPLTGIVLFKSLVFAKSLIEASIVHQNLISSSMPEKCFEKVDFVWQNRQQWIDHNHLCDGFNDAPIYIMKEFILQLCKPVNGILPAMLDVITNVIENHYNKVLLAHRDGNVMSVYTKFIAKVRIDKSEYARKVGPNEYHLQDGLNRCRFHKVNTDAMCCDCSYGKRGRMCEHLCALLILNDDTFVSFSSLDYNDRKLFLKILGDTETMIKCENENDLLQIEETAIDDERSKSCLSTGSEKNYDVEIKTEVQDPLETNHKRYESWLSRGSEENYDVEIKTEEQDPSKTDHENIDDERSKSWLSRGSEENYDVEIKTEEQDPSKTDHENIDDERSKSWLSSRGSEENYDVEIKTEEQDPLQTCFENENSVNVKFASEDTSKEELKKQYEACMKCVNDEFRRLDKLFRENPNGTNLYTMQRLAKELAKVVVVEEVDLSNMLLTLNKTNVTEDI